MKILVISDSHGQHDNVDLAIEREMPDRIFHLGDGDGCEEYIEAVGECPLEIVRGNCDFYSDLPAEVVMRVGEHVVMLTHGHYYNVNYGPDMLIDAAREKGADMVFYGHTHVPEIFYEEDLMVMNPGSISYPRQENRRPSYGVIEMEKTGKTHVEIKYL